MPTSSASQRDMEMKIVGASSGIGRALAATLSLAGYSVGVAARRTGMLASLREELSGPCVIKTIDVSEPTLAMPLLRELIDELGDVELFVVSAGTGVDNAELSWEPERETLAVNVLGFAAMVNVAVAHLEGAGVGASRRDILCGCLERCWGGAGLRGVQGIRLELPSGRAVSPEEAEAADRRRGRAARLR